MSPFDPNLDNDAGHAIDQDDLIAFHLHELSRPQERALHRVLQNNPALLAESLAIASTLRAFPKQDPTPATLDPTAAATRIWQSLEPNLTPYIPAATTPFAFLKLPLTRWAIPSLAGVAVATSLLSLTRFNQPHVQPTTITTAALPPQTLYTPGASVSPTNSLASPNSSTGVSTPTLSTSGFTRYTSARTATVPQSSIPIPPVQRGTTDKSSDVAVAQTLPGPVPPKFEPTSPAASSTSSLNAPPSPLATMDSRDQPAQPVGRSSPFGVQQATARRSVTLPRSQTDVALSLEGAFSNSAVPGNSNFYRQNAAAAAGGIVEFRHISSPLLGWEASYSLRRANQVYDELVEATGGASSCSSAVCPTPTYAVSANAQQFTADWIASEHTHGLRTFAVLGAGVLLTHPVSGQSGTANSTRAVFDYGAGVDWNFAPHLGIRMQYRGDLYKAPGIVPPNNTSPTTGLIHTSEPAIGFYYRF